LQFFYQYFLHRGRKIRFARLSTAFIFPTNEIPRCKQQRMHSMGFNAGTFAVAALATTIAAAET
jgi:hypothetical protein